ncbi:MAG TPA: response regulator transcription factor [Pyrinomonadaceae bacterium]|nr:response regulator transcription factor [Pyrinomonadaceae bacterium]
MERILVVDDDVELCALVTEYLEPEGFRVESAHDGLEGVERALANDYAIIILDVMLPGINGFEALRRIRAHSNTPVLMLTARGADVDRIVGLEIGADDYLPKSFNPRELVARIHAILRRTRDKGETSSTAAGETISLGDVRVNISSRTVHLRGELVDVTSTEFDVLTALLARAGHVVSREELSQAALGRPLAPLDRSIDMHVSSLRRKLGAEVNGLERIKTVRGTGYIYARASG